MAREDTSLRKLWRTYFEERCRPAVDALVEDHPQERSLYVDLLDLYEYDESLTERLFDAPDSVLGSATAALREAHEELGEVHVRVENNPGFLPVDALAARHLHELVTVRGVVSTVGDRRATALAAVYECPDCGESSTVRPRGRALSPPVRCADCDWTGPFDLRAEQSTFVDLQRVAVRSTVEDRDQSGDDRTATAVLTDDLVGAVTEGDDLLVTGIVRPERAGETNRFDFAIDANSVTEERGRPDHGDLRETIQSHWDAHGT